MHYTVKLRKSEVHETIEDFVMAKEKVNGIKALRERFGLGLRDAKELYETAAPVFETCQPGTNVTFKALLPGSTVTLHGYVIEPGSIYPDERRVRVFGQDGEHVIHYSALTKED